MIKQYIPISLLALCTMTGMRAVAQDQFSKDFDNIRQELTSWDPVRGEWLASSLVSMSRNEPIPDRMFPENFTPMEMLRAVPQSTRNAIASTATTGSQNSRDSLSRESWNRINSYVARANCRPVMGRTYGDPHLSSFDGASYSFQTVGEFVMVRSASRNMEVQTRQRAQSDNFSLNTAVAMNVGGDRLCLYANEKPDGNSTTPVRLNGEAIYVEDGAYYLPHGGTIVRSGKKDYLVTWPTGETVSIDMRNGAFPFMNIAIQLYPCVDSYEGVLGNANGRSSDDFDTRKPSRPAYLAASTFGSANDPAAQAMEKEYLAFLAKDFARDWRVTPQTSLFDYGFGQSTYTFTDESFPRVHHTLADLTPAQRDQARRDCERSGISGNDLNGCIFDRGFVNIPPSPRPVVDDQVINWKPRPVTNPTPNVNPGDVRRPAVGSDREERTPAGNSGTAQPISTQQDDGKTQPQTVSRPDSGTPTESPSKGSTASPAEKQPATQPQTVTRPAEPATQPTKTPAPATSQPEEKPNRSNNGFGRLLEKVGSSSSGSGSSSGRSSGSSSPKPASTSGSTPAPAPKTSAPAPKTSSPSTVTRGGR